MGALLHPGDRVALVACSNGLSRDTVPDVEELQQVLRSMQLEPVCSPYLYAADGPFSASGAQRARILETFWKDPEIRAVFDISGGDLANEVLSVLDLSAAAEDSGLFCGYSDLTAVLNALYTGTGRESWLYQLRWLTGACAGQQQLAFQETFLQGGEALRNSRWTFLRGTAMEGVVVGGNIRCFLKLAGTPWFPDLTGKLLLLESMGGGTALVMSQFQQLLQMGAFEKAAGVLLGSFVAMEDSGSCPTAPELLLSVLKDSRLPVAVTKDIGHRPDSRAMVIGRFLHLDA